MTTGKRKGRPRKPNHELSKSDLMETLRKHRSGMSLRQLARELDRSPSVIHKRIQKALTLESWEFV